jgi:hypothetical protein
MISLKNLLNTIVESQIQTEEQGPCWEGYQQIGMKEQDGKQVPNCVPIKESEKSKDSEQPTHKRKGVRLSPEQESEIDLDNDGKITKRDFKMLRKIKGRK